MLAMIILPIFTPFGSVRFWLTLVALLGLIGMQVVFWFATQPVNRCFEWPGGATGPLNVEITDYR